MGMRLRALGERFAMLHSGGRLAALFLATLLTACGGGGGGSGSGGGASPTPSNQPGTVTITGSATQGQTLTATVQDPDGVPASITYEWMANGTPIAGVSGNSFAPRQSEVGKAITVKVTYTDSRGNAETFTSTATAAVADVNDAPTLSFGGTGTMLLNAGSTTAYGVRLLASGQMLVSGGIINATTGSDFMLMRLNANGSPDLAFGSKGLVSTDFGGKLDYSAGHPTVLADGKILLVGAAIPAGKDDADFAMARYNADGTLDGGFGQGGKVTLDFRKGNDRINKAVVLADGRIVAVGGGVDPATGIIEMAAARFMSDGSLDTSFGTAGKVFKPVLANGGAEFEDVVVTPDGKLQATGEIGSGAGMLRMSANGALDSSFAMAGMNIGAFTSYRLLVTPDGAAYVVGARNTGSSYDWLIAKYGVDGFKDTSFGNGGEVVLDFNAAQDVPNDIIRLKDGSLLVAGYADSSASVGRYNVAMAKLLPTGKLDPSFGAGGRLAYDVSGYNDLVFGIDVQGDGRIVLAGTMRNQDGDVAEGAIGRLLANGDPDTSFGQPMGRYLEGQAPGVLSANTYANDPDVGPTGNYAGYVLKLQRAGGARVSDVFSGSDTLMLNGGQVTLSGTNLGSYTQSGGIMTITFGAGATQALLDKALSAIALSSNETHGGGRMAVDWSFTDPQGLAAVGQTVFYMADDYADRLDAQIDTVSLGNLINLWQDAGLAYYISRSSTNAFTWSNRTTGSSTALSDFNRSGTAATRGGTSLPFRLANVSEMQQLFAQANRPAAYKQGVFWTASKSGTGSHFVIDMATGVVRSAQDSSEFHPVVFIL